MLPSGKRLFSGNFVFMQDNNPKHKSKLCTDYLTKLQEHKILTPMDWPPQSPDPNQIELLWDELDRQIREDGPTSKNVLWDIWIFGCKLGKNYPQKL